MRLTNEKENTQSGSELPSEDCINRREKEPPDNYAKPAGKNAGGTDQRGRHSKTHGYTIGKKPPEYICWINIRHKCRNPRNPDYKYYGGRGIGVCSRWNSFAVFLSDMGIRPSSKHTIDRINNDGNYEPGNCRWATRLVQSNNRGYGNFITAFGESRRITEWARIKNLTVSCIRDRLTRGWTIEDSITKPIIK